MCNKMRSDILSRAARETLPSLRKQGEQRRILSARDDPSGWWFVKLVPRPVNAQATNLWESQFPKRLCDCVAPWLRMPRTAEHAPIRLSDGTR